ncbi:hypothetical protein [Trichothermofontia sp.]
MVPHLQAAAIPVAVTNPRQVKALAVALGKPTAAAKTFPSLLTFN